MLGNVTFFNALQAQKALIPIESTEEGIFTSVRLVQLMNVAVGMVVMPSGSVQEVRDLQLLKM